MLPIQSLNDLASRLGYPRAHLQRLVDELNADWRSHYRLLPLWESGAIVRQLRVPKPHLKEVQVRIKRNILDKLPISDSAHGSVKGRSSKTNASPHRGQRFVAKVDVRRFFPSVAHDAVFRLFREHLNFGRDVCRIMTRLTTVDDQLPQGSPTSPSLANLLLTNTVDEPLHRAAEAERVAYTRYVDDITLSGNAPQPLIQVAAKLLSRQGLRIHRGHEKLRVMPSGSAQAVTGIVVNHATRLSKLKRYRDGIRAAINTLPASPEMREAAERSVRGRIAYVHSIQPSAATKLIELLEKTLHGSAYRPKGASDNSECPK